MKKFYIFNFMHKIIKIWILNISSVVTLYQFLEVRIKIVSSTGASSKKAETVKKIYRNTSR